MEILNYMMKVILKYFAIAFPLAAVIWSGCDIIPWGIGADKIKGVSVSPGTTPTISWEGGPVNYLAVVPAEDKVGGWDDELCAVWAIQTPDRDDIYSPVTYGQVPEHAVDVTDSTYRQSALTLGVEYVVTVSCHDRNAIGGTRFMPPDRYNIKPERIEVQVSEGLTPTFSWEGMGVNLLSVFLVERTDSGWKQKYLVWGIHGSGRHWIYPENGPPFFGDVIHSPVTYGQVPEKVREMPPPTQLTSGATYEVEVSRWSLSDKGSRRFTPQ